MDEERAIDLESDGLTSLSRKGIMRHTEDLWKLRSEFFLVEPSDSRPERPTSPPGSPISARTESESSTNHLVKKASFKLEPPDYMDESESGDAFTVRSKARKYNHGDTASMGKGRQDSYGDDESCSISLGRGSYGREMSRESDVFDRDEYPEVDDKTSLRKKNKHEPICTMPGPLKNGLFLILSGIYGMVIIVLGGVLPIAEIFEGPERTYYIEGYYLYLYVLSIAFMTYVYLYLLRETHDTHATFKLAFATQAAAVATAAPSRKRTRRVSMDIRKHKQTGSFYLRLGAVGFGIGSMIHSGLQFGEYFQIYEGRSTHCSGVLQALKPITHLIFTFVQLYFIFQNAKMCIKKFEILARFGLMHMIGTNLCVWFRNIIVETLHEIHQHEAPMFVSTMSTQKPLMKYTSSSGVNNSHHTMITRALFGKHMRVAVSSNGNTTSHVVTQAPHHSLLLPEITCHFNDIMGRVVEQAGPYLYPCTIEYSLICAGILYVMWRNVGRDHTRHLPPAVDGEVGLYKHRMSVDCSSSSRGLFVGIFLFVFAVISIIAFFVMVQKEGMSYTAVIFVNLCEIITYTLASIAVLFAFQRMRALSYVMRGTNLEDNLIVISLVGVYIFAIFSIIAAFDDTESEGGMLIIVSDILLMVQATIQTVFMVCGMRMYATRMDHERNKPGRELVTFLLVCNIAMWGMTTFETQRSEHNPIQLHFYGYLAWAVFTHISVPLAIFFRFHSTVCLSNIWKQAWKRRTALTDH